MSEHKHDERFCVPVDRNRGYFVISALDALMIGLIFFTAYRVGRVHGLERAVDIARGAHE